MERAYQRFKDDTLRPAGAISRRPFCPFSRAGKLATLIRAVVGLSALSLVAGCGLRPPEGLAGSTEAGGSTDRGNGAVTTSQKPASPVSLFRDWPRPDLALLLSGQQHGHLSPCGCSRPQLGGLERRYNFVQKLKQGGWPVVAVDVGDLPQRSGPRGLPNVAGLLKYETAMKAQKLIGYTAVGIGQYEMEMPLFDALAAFALNNPSPRVLVANLQEREKLFPGQLLSWEVAAGDNAEPRVGIVGVVGPGVAQHSRDDAVRFSPVDKELPGVLKELQVKKPDILVLLFQGSVSEAKACAAKFPQFHVILCLSKEEEPSEKPEHMGNALIIGVGHKGRFVGVVGAFRTAKPDRPFEFRYQLVSMGEQYETPAEQEAGHPILALLEDYTHTVKANDFLSRYSQTAHPVQIDYPEATYVGSAKCKGCHEPAYDIWKASAHSHAYETLVDKARRPSLRQFDGECVVCHVVGFGYKGGFTSEEKTPLLKGVGCESCHGPASLHVRNPSDEKLRAALNPWKAQPGEDAQARSQRMNRIDRSCQVCHDIDNDVHWTFDKWVTGKIIHMNPE